MAWQFSDIGFLLRGCRLALPAGKVQQLKTHAVYTSTGYKLVEVIK